MGFPKSFRQIALTAAICLALAIPASGAHAAGGWDFVIMQQGPSATEGRPSLLEYSKRFGEMIRESGAEPALYMVWPAEDRPFDWDGVRDSYAMAADSAMGLFMPAGEGWRVAWESDSTLPFYRLVQVP